METETTELSEKEKLEIITDFWEKISLSNDIEPEFQKVINDNFWELI